ncbi:hypothetical protein OIV83_004027 [Microbotryomycetes sp. JL201]|nr:hypothetical protein OIV83_004027 [Microbotryomycetes sp. JL201]
MAALVDKARSSVQKLKPGNLKSSNDESGTPQQTAEPEEDEMILNNGAGGVDVAGQATKGGDSRSNSRIIDDADEETADVNDKKGGDELDEEAVGGEDGVDSDEEQRGGPERAEREEEEEDEDEDGPVASDDAEAEVDEKDEAAEAKEED